MIIGENGFTLSKYTLKRLGVNSYIMSNFQMVPQNNMCERDSTNAKANKSKWAKMLIKVHLNKRCTEIFPTISVTFDI